MCGIRPSRLVLAAVAAGMAAAVAASAPGADSARVWARARSADFDLLSDGGTAEALQAARALGRFRRLLGGLLPPRRRGPEAPIVVLAFHGDDSFRPYVPRHEGEPRAVEGFFQGGTARAFIAVNIGSARTDRYDALYHEYAHLALNRALPAQPAWVAEGLAELYAAWDLAGTEARVGLPRPEHLRVLRLRGLLPLEEVLGADYTSELYRRGDRFYAQSWLLAHYLVLGRPGGREQLQEYLIAITQGLDGAAAFGRAFGEEPSSLATRLRAYLDSGPLPMATVAFAEGGDDRVPPEAALQATVPAPAEVECLLADLLLHQDRPREARGHLARALEADPGYGPAREGLAQVALSQARWEEARAQLRAALEREPDSPPALYRYADALVKEASQRGEVLSDADGESAVTALEKAVARAPHFADAAELLARLRPRPARPRIALLEPAVAREPQRTDIALTLAGLYVRVGDLGAAAAVLARARAAARDEDMRFLAGHLLGRVGLASSLTGEVTGTLVRLECLAGGALDFVIEAPPARITLRAPTPRAVLLYGPDGEPSESELVCGPQSAAVTARYQPRADRDGPEGTLVSITWRDSHSE